MLLVMGALGGIVWLLDPPQNELGLRGGFRVRAGPDAEIFIGDRLVGVASVDVSWDEILGADGGSPMAIPAPNSASAPSVSAIDPAVAEALGGPGASVLDSKPAVSGSGSTVVMYAGHIVLLRRSDGALDQFAVWDCQIKATNGAHERFLVAIRLRYPKRPDGQPLAALIGVGKSEELPIRGGGTWMFADFFEAKAPDAHKQEVNERGLWHP